MSATRRRSRTVSRPAGSRLLRGLRVLPLAPVAALLVVAIAGSSADLTAQEDGARPEESVQGMDESPAFETAPAIQEPSGSPDPADAVDRPVQPHPEAEEAIGRLRSPWCPGFMLEVCPSPQAAAFRDTLRMMAHQGLRADSLVDWALARHGEEWLALPEARGTGLLAWLGPPLALLLGIVLVVVALRRLRRASDREGPDDERPRISEEEERRIEEAVRELEWS